MRCDFFVGKRKPSKSEKKSRQRRDKKDEAFESGGGADVLRFLGGGSRGGGEEEKHGKGWRESLKLSKFKQKIFLDTLAYLSSHLARCFEDFFEVTQKNQTSLGSP